MGRRMKIRIPYCEVCPLRRQLGGPFCLVVNIGIPSKDHPFPAMCPLQGGSIEIIADEEKSVLKGQQSLFSWSSVAEQETYNRAVEYVQDGHTPSITRLKRHLGISYQDAHKIFDRMKKDGVIIKTGKILDGYRVIKQDEVSDES